MADLALFSLAYLAGAVFHAAVHVAGHESYHAVKLRVERRLLLNHDLQRALRLSFLAAIGMLQQNYRRTRPSRDQWREAKTAFRKLRAQGDRLYLPAGEAPWEGEIEIDSPADTARADALVSSLIRSCGEIPRDIEELFRAAFPAAYSYAFREIGLKKDPAVRAVVTQQILGRIESSAASSQKMLGEINRALQDGLVRLQSNLESSADMGFEQVLNKLEALEESQHHLLDLIKKPTDASGSVAGVLSVSDLDGYQVASQMLREGALSVGRGQLNDVRLPSKGVSARHASLEITNRAMVVRDLGSKHGTFVNGDRVDRSTKFKLRDEIQIGPYILEVFGPEDADLVLLTLPTASDPMG